MTRFISDSEAVGRKVYARWPGSKSDRPGYYAAEVICEDNKSKKYIVKFLDGAVDGDSKNEDSEQEECTRKLSHREMYPLDLLVKGMQISCFPRQDEPDRAYFREFM